MQEAGVQENKVRIFKLNNFKLQLFCSKIFFSNLIYFSEMVCKYRHSTFSHGLALKKQTKYEISKNLDQHPKNSIFKIFKKAGFNSLFLVHLSIFSSISHTKI